MQVADLHAAALAQDASVFDYDGVYDSIQVRDASALHLRTLACLLAVPWDIVMLQRFLTRTALTQSMLPNIMT